MLNATELDEYFHNSGIIPSIPGVFFLYFWRTRTQQNCANSAGKKKRKCRRPQLCICVTIDTGCLERLQFQFFL
jgi:hypothetical protein